MITNVTIKDNENTPLDYLHKIKAFANGMKYDFKPGINIVIGKNGCGKSTLLKLISTYCLCDKDVFSKLPYMREFGDAAKMDYLFKENKLRDGVEVHCDYNGVVYNYFISNEIANNTTALLSSAKNVAFWMMGKSLSTGQVMTYSLQNLIKTAFSNTDVQFPIEDIKRTIKKSNSLWEERFNSLLEYYKKNKVIVDRDGFEFTFLMDEPDRNLDVTHIQDLYRILSHKKDMTQLICVIHNPILIYKLSKLDDINFIEMTDGYLNDVKQVFKAL